MAFDLNSIYVDPAAGETGAWVDCFSGSKLKLAYTEGKKYKTALAKLVRQHRLELDDNNEASYDLIQSVTARALADNVLLDWSGIIIDGEERPYTKELGYQVLLNYPKIREFVVEKAAEPATFKEVLIEKVKK